MNGAVSSGNLRGTVTAPPSKSLAHRALICAALADGISRISPIDRSTDMDATIGALTAMGARITRSGHTVTVQGIKDPPLSAEIDCIESGSTVRFLIPIAAALGINARFSGSGRLPERPLTPYEDMFPRQGVTLDSDKLPLTINGKLNAGTFSLRGDISSQFITGLLLALPLLDGDSEILLTGKPESAPYIRLTLAVLQEFGIKAVPTDRGYFIPGNQRYQPCCYSVEGDFSNAAFWLTAASLGMPVKVNNLLDNSLQGDRAIIAALEKMGAVFAVENGSISVLSPVCRPTVIDGRNIPDVIPILTVAATAVNGETIIEGTRRLKIKESDRSAAMVDCLTRLGAEIKEEEDRLIIHGGKKLHGAPVDGYNDHRIVMSMAVASCLTEELIEIKGAQAIRKSYPGFWEDWCRLGGIFHVL